MRIPTQEQWERWRRIRRENDERERREGTYCAVRDYPAPDYERILESQHELDQFERSTPLLIEDEEWVLLQRPDGRLIRARFRGTKPPCDQEG